MECERCKKLGADVRLRPCMTAYARQRLNAWTRLLLDDELLGEAENPNQDPMLCDECHEDYRDYWDEMWSYARSQ